MVELDITLILSLVVIFILSGVVKGLAGFGMPLIAIPASTLLTGVPVTTAMGWALAALILTNLTQAIGAREHYRGAILTWPLLVGLFVAMGISVQMLAHIDPEYLSVFVGIMILVVVGSQALKPWHVASRWQPLFLGTSGVISGLVGGLTSFFGFPALQAMLAIGLTTGQFIFAVSIMFFFGTIIIAIALGGYGLVNMQDAMISLMCVVPGLIGMKLGQRVRDRISVTLFKRVVLVLLMGTGMSMVYNGLTG